MQEQFNQIKNQQKNGKKIGLALGGGGARGLAHIGVIKALERYQIPIHFIAGTSMGALVGGWYAANKNVWLLESMFLQVKDKDIMPSEKVIKNKDGVLFKDELIVEFLEKGFKNKSFDDCAIPFAAVATNVENGDEVMLKEGKLADAIRASVAIPVIFKPVKINGQILSDGALANPVPADIVKKMGADIVIAVDVSSRWINLSENIKQPKDFYSVISEAFSVVSYQISKQVLKKADLVIRPPVLTYSFLQFNRAKEIIAAGAQEIKRNLPEIEQKTGYRRTEPETIIEKIFNFMLDND
jgi:NTE family protein